MKNILVAAVLALSTSAFAGDTYFQIHGFSKHLNERSVGVWNERNLGAGVRHQFDKDHGVQAGFYRNSINRDTIYALYQYTPLQVSKTSFGAFAGYASGYKYEIPAIAGFMSTTYFNNNKTTVSIRFVPKVKVTESAVFAIEAGFKF